MGLISLAVCVVLMTDDPIQYPVTRTVPHTDTYHGVTVDDPYRWLEQPIAEPEVKGWVDEQNKVTFAFLDKIAGRDRLLAELRSRVNYERFGLPVKRGGKYFFERNDGLQNQNVWRVAASLTDEGRVLLDPNTLSTDGTVALVSTDVTDDGTKFLYATSVSGSDWCTWQAIDVATGKPIGEQVEWSKFGVGFWDKTGEGFYYLSFPRPAGDALTSANVEPKVMYHRLGTQQSDDKLVFELKEHPDWYVWPAIDEKREAIWLYVNEPGSVNNRLWMLDLKNPELGAVKLFDENDADYLPVHKEGSRVWVQTTKDAPKGRILLIDTVRRIAPVEVVPPGQDSLQGASVIGGRLVLRYLRDAKTAVTIHGLDGQRQAEVPLPGPGTAGGFQGRSDDTETFFTFVSMVQPTTVYRLDVQSNGVTVHRAPKLGFDTGRYTSTQVFVTGKDGTKIPMFLAHRKDLKLDSSNPTILYGYGGFGAAMSPFFSTADTVWMDMGGVFAIACIRGGSEYGKEWHEAAIKTKRQNAYDDFIACGEWLVANQYCDNKRLAVQGGSNGGLLVGAVMTQRPDLIGVALPAVGVMDLLRFNQFTVGKGWEGDYGSPENRDEFFTIWRVSPYHNLRPGTNYPATLVTTADTDDRVVPAHSFKFAARLQAVQAGSAPVLIRVETSAGHGGGMPISKQLEIVRDEFAFTVAAMGRAIPERF
jgi:prolyl oligopeptidase